LPWFVKYIIIGFPDKTKKKKPSSLFNYYNLPKNFAKTSFISFYPAVPEKW